jgi:hypothetical protein
VREAALMRQLREVREWRERFGMGVAGGPVRVSPGEPEPGPERAPERGVASSEGAEIVLDFGEPDDG